MREGRECHSFLLTYIDLRCLHSCTLFGSKYFILSFSCHHAQCPACLVRVASTTISNFLLQANPSGDFHIYERTLSNCSKALYSGFADVQLLRLVNALELPEACRLQCFKL